MSDVERFEMPNGSVVWYRPERHEYWERSLNGKCSGRVPGISSIAKNDGDQFNDPLLNWAARLTCEGVAREASLGLSLDDAEDIRSALSWLESGPAVERTLQQERLTWRDLRDEAGQRGSLAHGILSDLAEGKVPRPESPYDEATIAWWNATQPVPIMVEQVCYDAERKFAGRFDLMYGEADQRVLADLKTSRWISGSFFCQLNLYRLALMAAGFPEPQRLAVIQVNEDATWAEIPVPIRPDWALNALTTYRMGKELTAAIRSGKKQAQERLAA